MEPKDILTAVSVLVSACALLYAWRKNSLLRRREHADRFRRAAGSIVARLERYRALALGFFHEMQPLLTEADSVLVKEQDPVVARDFLWRGLVALRAELSRRELSEEIELAYVDLFGYDTRIHALFTEVLMRLQLTNLENYNDLLEATQHSTLTLPKPAEGWQSAALGNVLRQVCSELSREVSVALWQITAAFEKEMTLLATASDVEIVQRRVTVGTPEHVFRSIEPSKQRKPTRLPLYFTFKGGIGRSLALRPAFMVNALAPDALATEGLQNPLSVSQPNTDPPVKRPSSPC